MREKAAPVFTPARRKALPIAMPAWAKALPDGSDLRRANRLPSGTAGCICRTTARDAIGIGADCPDRPPG
jgi:hypothetical protein